MAYTIHTEDVLRALRPVLGTRFPRGTGLDEQVAQLLRSHTPRREERADLRLRLRDCIFSAIYTHLGSAMLLQLEDGRVRRILLQDVDALVDACFGVLLCAMPAWELPPESLRAMAMTEGSLAAMRALLAHYAHTLPDLEAATLRRILAENGVPQEDIP